MTTTVHRRPPVAAVAVAALLAVVLVSGCGGQKRATRPEITLVTYSSFVLDPEVEQSVERRLGIELTVSASGDSGEALAKAILAAGNPSGDVFFGIDNTTVARARSADLFEAPRGVDVPSWARVVGADDVVAVDWGAVCVDYDRAWFSSKGLAPPRTLADLVDPAYRDLLVVPDPATSTPGLVFLAGIHASTGDPDRFVEGLRANGAVVVGSWDQAWFERYTVSGGDRPIVVSYASSPPAEVFYSDGKVTEPSSAVATDTCVRQVEMAGVLRGSEHPELAARLLREMLGASWQSALPLTNFVEPLRPGVRRPELFERWAPVPEHPISLDPATVARDADGWIERWRDTMA